MSMQLFLGGFLCISAITFTGLELRAQQGICAKIACSGHGQCVETASGPACACHEGYVPDETRLNCVAEASSFSSSLGLPSDTAEDNAENSYSQKAEDPASATSQSSSFSVQPGSASEDNVQVDYERVKAALPQYSHEKEFLRYGRLRQTGMTIGSFVDYKLYRARKKRNSGIAMVAVGGVLLVSFLAFITVSAADDWEIYLGPALSSLFIGAVLIPVGAVRMKRGKTTREALSGSPYDTPDSVLSRFSLSPTYNERTSTFGLSGRFVF